MRSVLSKESYSFSSSEISSTTVLTFCASDFLVGFLTRFAGGASAAAGERARFATTTSSSSEGRPETAGEGEMCTISGSGDVEVGTAGDIFVRPAVTEVAETGAGLGAEMEL